jgi:hypothetical protein
VVDEVLCLHTKLSLPVAAHGDDHVESRNQRARQCPDSNLLGAQSLLADATKQCLRFIDLRRHNENGCHVCSNLPDAPLQPRRSTSRWRRRLHALFGACGV